MGRFVHNCLTDLKVKKASCPSETKAVDFRDGDGLILRVQVGLISELSNCSFQHEEI